MKIKTENYEKYYKGLLPYLKKEKNQQYLTILLTIGASIFFGLFAINPTLSTIAKLKKEIADDQVLNEQLTQKIDNLSTLAAQYESVQNDVPFIESAVPKKPEAPTMIAQIQSLASQDSITLNNLTTSPLSLQTVNSSTSSKFTYNISAVGNYEDMSSFLQDLVNMERALTVDTFLITEIGGDHVVDGEIQGSAFYKK